MTNQSSKTGEREAFEEWWDSTIHGRVWRVMDERSQMAAKDTARGSWLASRQRGLKEAAEIADTLFYPDESKKSAYIRDAILSRMEKD
jgi:hypothetical protein